MRLRLVSPATDPGSRNNSTVGVGSPSNGGINRYLVLVCVEYLQQPVALREEGLFRVPGDSSLMKALHRDFQSHTVGKEHLRSESVTMATQHSVNNFCNRGDTQTMVLVYDTAGFESFISVDDYYFAKIEMFSSPAV